MRCSSLDRGMPSVPRLDWNKHRSGKGERVDLREGTLEQTGTSMSDHTPRTDTIRSEYRGDVAGLCTALIIHSNKLERELAKAIERVKELEDELRDIAAFGTKHTGCGFTCANMARDALMKEE